MTTIPLSFDRLDRVYHMADIHIRLFQRHDEYRDVFETLYEDLRSRETENSVILIAGDILHAKLDISPEMIQLVSEFLMNCADIMPTLITDGNHDLNLSNLHRMRSLEAIVNNIKEPNLHYLRDTGVYQVADKQIAVFGITDKPEDWPDASELTSEVKIATYHGPVYGAKTDTNYTISSRHVEVSKFDGYDIVMLGDIHRAQVLKDKGPIVVYPGSLIQQNHGEDLDGHGYVIWDFEDGTYDHIEVPNRIGYVTLEVDKDDVKGFKVPDNLPDELRLRLFTNGVKNTDIKRIISIIKGKYKVLDVSIHHTQVDPSELSTQNQKFDIGDLTDINVQNGLIKGFLNHNHQNLSDETVEEVLKINSRMNGEIQYTDQSRNIHWKPIYFKFENLFSYGEDNYIDFRNLRGTQGIFAPNATGKSSSMESLIFTLFDKAPRAFRGDHIMNIRKDSFECELAFEVNGETYVIKRVGTKNKNGSVRVDVEFWQQKEDGSKINLNGEDRFSTNAAIRSVVGTYEDFILTTLSGQNGSSLFIDKSNTERKNLLNQFMGLNVFESLYAAANEEVKQIQGVLKKFKREDFTTKLNEYQEKIQETRTFLDEIQTQVDEHERLLENNQSEIEALSSQKLNVPVSTIDVTSLENSIVKQEKKKGAIQKNLDVLEGDKKVLESKIKTADDKVKEYDVELLKEHNELHDQYSGMLTKKVALHKQLLSSLDNVEETIEQISGFKYNPDCDVCVENNKTTIDQISKLQDRAATLRDDISKASHEISDLELKLDEYSESVEKYKSYKSVQLNLDELQSDFSGVLNDIDRYKNSINTIDSEIRDLRKDIKQSEEYHDSIEKNKEIDEKIKSLRKEQRRLKKEFDLINSRKIDLHSTLKVNQNNRDDMLERLEEVSEMEKEYEAYGYYLETVSRNGLPYFLISKTIPNIESEINAILSQIVPFTIALDVDGKNFGGRIVYDHERSWPLENSSGMERFISSIAIRVALLRASNLPKSNFLIIDEGMGGLDTEYLHNMQLLFDLLKAQFDFVVIISHLDNVRDMVDETIEITKVNGYSQINTRN